MWLAEISALPALPGRVVAEVEFPKMCGIAGILNLDPEPVERELVRDMLDRIAYRGPDGSGVHTERNVGLGNVRLSILDLAGGQQPMANEDGSLWITFNGEIFNYLELREELEARGHEFTSRTDTEVVLHLYEEEGEGCVERFNGQWAFAIWDARRRRLFLSRDRLGVRPLYYTVQNGALVFASEVKSVLTHPGVRAAVDLAALDQVFTFWCPVAPRTFFEGVRELPPGHSLTADGEDVRLRPYWRLDFSPERESSGGEGASASRLRELLEEATRIRLRSDVPVGAYLSGGLDSTVVTALVRRVTGGRLKTFSVTFEDPDYDEEDYQREAVEFLGTEHRAIRCTLDDVCRVFPEVVRHSETPILRTAPAPLYLLSSLVREEGYKVVLTGEGADELFGGYEIYKESKVRRFLGAQRGSKLRPLLLGRLYPYLPNLRKQSPSYLEAFFHARPEDLSDPLFSHLPRWMLTSKLKVFFSEDVRAALAGRDALEELRARLPSEYARWDGFSQAQYLETALLLPGYILSSQGDRMAMAHSVEGRFPFLDHRVVEFGAALPPRLKMRALKEKFVLKEAARGLVPRRIVERHKQPYRAPEAASFFSGGRPRQDYVEEALGESRIRKSGLFNPAAVRRLVGKITRGSAIGVKDNMALVGILSTQLLVERFIGNVPRFHS